MKKLIVACFVLVLLLPVAAQAQSYPVDRGSWIVGGAAGFISASGGDDGRVSTLFFDPSAQYFIVQNVAVGGTVSLNYTTQDSFTSRSAGVGPTVAYYFGGRQSTVYPFLAAGLSYTRRTFEFEGFSGLSRNSETTTTTLAADIAGGVVLMLAKNVGFAGAVFYEQERFELEQDDDFFEGEEIDLDAFGFRLGVRVFAF